MSFLCVERAVIHVVNAITPNFCSRTSECCVTRMRMVLYLCINSLDCTFHSFPNLVLRKTLTNGFIYMYMLVNIHS